MDSEIEGVKYSPINYIKTINTSCMLFRTKCLRTAEDYYLGKAFMTSGYKTYYCLAYQEIDGYYYMRMVTDEQ